jgi:tRNA dimethylallyltransferase
MNPPETVGRFGDQTAPLLAIVGPTASGKSSLGVWLAKRLGGEIVVCDSTQVYRGFDIGTSKPTEAERQGVAHHMLDLAAPDEVFTAGEYRKQAILVLTELRTRGRLPIVVAGTGLYLRALLEGLADAPMRSEEFRARLRTSADRHSPGYLHKLLKRIDPEAAARIAPRDKPKLIRALEISVLAGKPVTEVLGAGRKKLEGFRAVKIGLMPYRTALYERIERRTLEMMDRGWLAEVRGLVAAKIPQNAKPFSFIGYNALREHSYGKGDLASCIPKIQQATRRYAKRQLTWFRKEPHVRWFEGFGDDPDLAPRVLQYLIEEGGLKAVGSAGAGGTT